MGGEKFRWESTADPKYCITFQTATFAMQPCVIDVWDLENEVKAYSLSTEKPTPDHMFGSDICGDVIFAAGGEGNAAIRVYSASGGDMKGSWRGIAESQLYSCAIVETPSLIGAAGPWSAGPVRLFDINTCTPCATLTDSPIDGAATYTFADPINRAAFYVIEGSGKIHQFDARAAKRQRTLVGNGGGWPTSVSFPQSAGGKFVVSGNGVNVLDSITGKVLWHGELPNGPNSACLAGNVLVYGNYGKVYFFDTNKLGSTKELDFDKADHDVGCPGNVDTLGGGIRKITVFHSNGTASLSLPKA